ncbi:MAG: sirohydrochlorin cobaltochelatase [Lachnospirales bacterium]
MSNKAILVVSFGSSYKGTREKTLDVIEREIREAFPEYKIYSAYTSKTILKILKTRDSLEVYSVVEAFEKIQQDGIQEIIVQPTLMLNGVEFNIMKEEASKFKDKFQSIKFGDPLLSTTADFFAVVNSFLKSAPSISENEAIILMAHGNKNFSNDEYTSLKYIFKTKGKEHIYLGTGEYSKDIVNIIDILKRRNYKKIILIPFMIVAGKHAIKDMASEDEGSWMSLLNKAGFEVECIVKGLGENREIRGIIIEHIRKARILFDL